MAKRLPPRQQGKIGHLPVGVESRVEDIQFIFSVFLLRVLTKLANYGSSKARFLRGRLIRRRDARTSKVSTRRRRPGSARDRMSKGTSTKTTTSVSRGGRGRSTRRPTPRIRGRLPRVSSAPRAVCMSVYKTIADPKICRLPCNDHIFRTVRRTKKCLPRTTTDCLGHTGKLSSKRRICIPARTRISDRQVTTARSKSRIATRGDARATDKRGSTKRGSNRTRATSSARRGVSLGATSMSRLAALANMKRSGTLTVVTCERRGNPFASTRSVVGMPNVGRKACRGVGSGVTVGWKTLGRRRDVNDE